MIRYPRSIACARRVPPLLMALLAAGGALLGAAAAQGADEFPIPLVMKHVPPDRGSWQVEMLEGPKIAEMKQQTGGTIKMCVTAAQAAEQRHAPAAHEPQCSSRLIENGATRAVLETTCKGPPPARSRSTITADGPRAFLVTHDQETPAAAAAHIKVRMSYLGPCSESDATMSLGKDSPACAKARAQMAGMDSAKQCAAAGEHHAQCEAMLEQARARLEAMCR